MSEAPARGSSIGTRGTADITADPLKALQHAQAGRRPLGPLPVANDSLHPGPPFATTLEGTDIVRESP